MGHGDLSDMRHYHFLNSTRDIGGPRQGPQLYQNYHYITPSSKIVIDADYLHSTLILLVSVTGSGAVASWLLEVVAVHKTVASFWSARAWKLDTVTDALYTICWRPSTSPCSW